MAITTILPMPADIFKLPPVERHIAHLAARIADLEEDVWGWPARVRLWVAVTDALRQLTFQRARGRNAQQWTITVERAFAAVFTHVDLLRVLESFGDDRLPIGIDRTFAKRFANMLEPIGAQAGPSPALAAAIRSALRDGLGRLPA